MSWRLLFLWTGIGPKRALFINCLQSFQFHLGFSAKRYGLNKSVHEKENETEAMDLIICYCKCELLVIYYLALFYSKILISGHLI